MGRPGARWLGVIMVDSQGIKSVLASPVSVKQNWEIYGCAKKRPLHHHGWQKEKGKGIWTRKKSWWSPRNTLCIWKLFIQDNSSSQYLVEGDKVWDTGMKKTPPHYEIKGMLVWGKQVSSQQRYKWCRDPGRESPCHGLNSSNISLARSPGFQSHLQISFDQLPPTAISWASLSVKRRIQPTITRPTENIQ